MIPRKKNTSKAPAPKPDAPGISFEKAVARIQQMMEPNSIVSHDVIIKDRRGIDRQFDVVIRGKFSGQDFLVVIECKDYGRNVGLDTVDEFAKKAEHVRANMRIIFARNGFSENAIKAAKHEGIGTLSLLPQDFENITPSMFIFSYRCIRNWHDMKFWITFHGKSPGFEYDTDSLRHEGIPLSNFYLNLLNQYSSFEKGSVVIENDFAVPLPVVVKGKEVFVRSVRFTAIRKTMNKRRQLPVAATGFFDWQKETPIFPPNTTSIRMLNLRSDMKEWEDLAGDIPKTGPFEMVAHYFADAIDKKSPIPSLDEFMGSINIIIAPFMLF